MRAGKESRAFTSRVALPRDDQREYAGPRLQAAIRASTDLMPPTFWTAYLGSHDELLAYFVAETAAIGEGDPDAARAACAETGRADGADHDGES